MKKFPCWALALLLGGVALLSGCVVARQARDLPGDNPQLIQTGATRAEVEKALGPPLRTWQPSAQVTYQLHQFRAPLRGSNSDAAAMVFMDVITLGLVEAIDAVNPKHALFSRDHLQTYSLLWFGFDATDHLCGVYPTYAVLPEQPVTHLQTTSPSH